MFYFKQLLISHLPSHSSFVTDTIDPRLHMAWVKLQIFINVNTDKLLYLYT